MAEVQHCLHPNGKRSTPVHRGKYKQMRQEISDLLKVESLQLAELEEAVKQRLIGKFDGSIGWYFMVVRLDMEARGDILRDDFNSVRLGS